MAPETSSVVDVPGTNLFFEHLEEIAGFLLKAKMCSNHVYINLFKNGQQIETTFYGTVQPDGLNAML